MTSNKCSLIKVVNVQIGLKLMLKGALTRAYLPTEYGLKVLTGRTRADLSHRHQNNTSLLARTAVCR